MTDKKKTKCKRCGKCCRVIFVDLNKKPPKDWIYWANLRKGIRIIKQMGRWMMRIELKCSKLKANKCSIYQKRPYLCREYNCWEKGFPKP